MLKSEKRHCTDGQTKQKRLYRRILFPPSNGMSKQQAPETRWSLFRMKHHCQDHLDPDYISLVTARLKFNKIIFGDSKGTQDNTEKHHKLRHRSFFLSVTRSHRKHYLN